MTKQRLNTLVHEGDTSSLQENQCSDTRAVRGQLFEVINEFCSTFCVAIFVTKNKLLERQSRLVSKVKNDLSDGLMRGFCDILSYTRMCTWIWHLIRYFPHFIASLSLQEKANLPVLSIPPCCCCAPPSAKLSS